MNPKPKCIIVTGRQGAGKTTLAKRLAEKLWMPAIIRDEIKEGYVSTRGIRHDELPDDTNRVVTNLFFKIVNKYLAGSISVVIEAAFQHGVWEPRMPEMIELARVCIVRVSVEESVAADRSIQRGLADPDREFYHGDNRVVHFKKTGEILTPASYEEPNFEVPTIRVRTEDGYSPSVDEIAEKILSIDA